MTVKLHPGGKSNGLILIYDPDVKSWNEAGRYWENGAIAKIPGCQKIADLIAAVELLRKIQEGNDGN